MDAAQSFQRKWGDISRRPRRCREEASPCGRCFAGRKEKRRGEGTFEPIEKVRRKGEPLNVTKKDDYDTVCRHSREGTQTGPATSGELQAARGRNFFERGAKNSLSRRQLASASWGTTHSSQQRNSQSKGTAIN